MQIIPQGHPLKRATRGTALAMDAASLAVTLVAVIALAYGAKRLLDGASTHFDMGGGWTFLDYVRQHATNPEAVKAMLPGLHLRAMWWVVAWVQGVFGVGCALLAVAGARALYWRAHGLVRSA